MIAVGCGDDENGDTDGSEKNGDDKNGDSDKQSSDCKNEEVIDEDISEDTTWNCIDADARNNTFGTDPEFGSVSETSPDYIPANDDLADQAEPSFGDKDATYAGAFEPNASDD